MTKKKRINWEKILANALISFATTGAATISIGMGQDGLMAALVAAFFTGLLAAGTELKKESDAFDVACLQQKLLVV